jgi:7-carboxy-7-deazaguanine synthase
MAAAIAPPASCAEAGGKLSPEPLGELRGQRNILHSAGGRGADRACSGVLPFAGCNLWSGREADRDTAICPFCDTDFVGTNGTAGGRYPDAEALADNVAGHWPKGAPARFVVCTGGEPLLQLDPPLIGALHDRRFEIAVETSGTIPPPPGLDWVCVSPKAGARLVVERGDELKVVVPQAGLDPCDFAHLAFRGFFPCSRWTDPTAPATPNSRWPFAAPTRSGN